MMLTPIPTLVVLTNRSQQNSAFAVACEGCTGDCYNCTVGNPNRVQECKPVPEHTTSLDANGSLESLTLRQGFWRSYRLSKEIRACYEASACVGGTETYCREGYQGPRECRICDISEHCGRTIRRFTELCLINMILILLRQRKCLKRCCCR